MRPKIYLLRFLKFQKYGHVKFNDNESTKVHRNLRDFLSNQEYKYNYLLTFNAKHPAVL